MGKQNGIWGPASIEESWRVGSIGGEKVLEIFILVQIIHRIKVYLLFPLLKKQINSYPAL
jgi:hypothetical protein